MSVIFPPVSYAGATSASVSEIQIDVGDPSAYGTDLYTLASATKASISNIQIDIGDPSADGTDLYTLVSAKANGRFQIFEKSITSPANAGTTTVATITAQPCLIEEIVLHSDTASQGWLSSAAVHGGENSIITFLSATDATADNIDIVDEQISWTGAVRLAAGKPIIIDLQGTGATAVDLTVILGYRACADGGYLV